MRDALSGTDGTQALPAGRVFVDALSAAQRREDSSDVQEIVEQQHENAVRRLVERGAVPQRRRPERDDERGAQAAQLTAAVPDAHGPTRRSSSAPQQNLVTQSRGQLDVPTLQPYR